MDKFEKLLLGGFFLVIAISFSVEFANTQITGVAIGAVLTGLSAVVILGQLLREIL